VHHLLQILPQRTKLRSLGFDADLVTSTGSEEIAPVVNLLGPNYHLEDLVVSCNDVSVLCDIFEALGTNSTLTFLEVGLDCDDDDDDALFRQGLERLGTLLPEIKTLKKLTFLSDDFEGREIPKVFVRGLELNTSLLDVDAEWMDDDEKAAIKLSQPATSTVRAWRPLPKQKC